MVYSGLFGFTDGQKKKRKCRGWKPKPSSPDRWGPSVSYTVNTSSNLFKKVPKKILSTRLFVGVVQCKFLWNVSVKKHLNWLDEQLLYTFNLYFKIFFSQTMYYISLLISADYLMQALSILSGQCLHCVLVIGNCNFLVDFKWFPWFDRV